MNGFLKTSNFGPSAALGAVLLSVLSQGVSAQDGSAHATPPPVVVRQVLPPDGQFPFSCETNRKQVGKFAITSGALAQQYKIKIQEGDGAELYKVRRADVQRFATNELCELEVTPPPEWRDIVFLFAPKGGDMYEFFKTSNHEHQPLELTDSRHFVQLRGALHVQKLRISGSPMRAAILLLSAELQTAKALVTAYAEDAERLSQGWRFTNLQAYLLLLKKNVESELGDLEAAVAAQLAVAGRLGDRVTAFEDFKKTVPDTLPAEFDAQIVRWEKAAEPPTARAAELKTYLDKAKKTLRGIAKAEASLFEARHGAKGAAAAKAVKQVLEGGTPSVAAR